MIAVRLIGGLGNQMFQYAAGRALADRLGVELLVDAGAFSTYTLHAYGLEKFAVRARRATTADMRAWPEWLRRPMSGLRRFGVSSRWYAEPAFTYDAAWPTLGDGLHLNGYFQSEKYFREIAGSLRNDLVPRVPLSAANAGIAAAARDCNSVMVHVRRGDYVSNAKNLGIHGVCSTEYYRRAIARLSAELDQPRFFVFSDDLDWARANLPLGDDAVFVAGNGGAPEVDIHLMSQCRHHVIANSSFSWWGAWLGEKAGQRVIAPAPWFETATLSDEDLVPARWQRLPKNETQPSPGAIRS